MTYTAITASEFREKTGTLSSKLASEFSDIDTEIDSVNTNIDAHKSKFVLLSGAIGTRTAIGTTGVDIADGSGGTYYGVFFAPVDITVVKMYVLYNEAYVKDTDDASVAIADNAAEAVTIFTLTPDAEGVDAGGMETATPEDGVEDIDAGTRLDLVIGATASSSGTGHVDVILEYYEA